MSLRILIRLILMLLAMLLPHFVDGVLAKGRSISIQFDDETVSARGCDAIRVTSDDGVVEADATTMSFPRSEAPSFAVAGWSNGGVWTSEWDRDVYEVRVCRAAVAATAAEARRLLDALEVTRRGGRVDAHGPAGETWQVFLLVRTPKGVPLDLESLNGSIRVEGASGAVRARSTNGAVTLRDVSAAVDARTQNGPISIRDCDGAVEANAQNGPVSYEGSSGELTLRTQNGPVSVELTGSRWEGSGLTASTVNGPVSLTVPAGFRSGVRVQASSHAPFSCLADGCGEGRRSWDDDGRFIEFGEGEILVRLSTQNGPVSISSDRRPRRERKAI